MRQSRSLMRECANAREPSHAKGKMSSFQPRQQHALVMRANAARAGCAVAAGKGKSTLPGRSSHVACADAAALRWPGVASSKIPPGAGSKDTALHASSLVQAQSARHAGEACAACVRHRHCNITVTTQAYRGVRSEATALPQDAQQRTGGGTSRHAALAV